MFSLTRIFAITKFPYGKLTQILCCYGFNFILAMPKNIYYFPGTKCMTLKRKELFVPSHSCLCVIAPRSLQRPLEYTAYSQRCGRRKDFCGIKSEGSCPCSEVKSFKSFKKIESPPPFYCSGNMYPKDAPPPYGPSVPMHTVVVPTSFGRDPQTLTCPSCHTIVNTRVDSESTTKTHLFAILLLVFVCPCFWLPYCMDSCKATNHYCPKCGAYLGGCDR